MHFNRVHIEVTNICGLACSFCPPKLQPTKTMSLEFFEKVLLELKPYTKSLAFHIMGDPLILSNLFEYLELAFKHGFEVELTTSGYYLSKTPIAVMFHPAVRQLNISLNSYNKNSLNLSFEEYMDGVFSTCKSKLESYPKPFINLRVWNLDDILCETEFNAMLFDSIEKFFDVKLNLDEIYTNGVKSLRIASKVLLNFDNYFEWPSLKSMHDTQGTCYGIKSHIGILADGSVVPCCLDGEGVINLGNLHETHLSEVLGSKRTQDMIQGFAQGRAVEELCRKCSYKDRFEVS
ncbi:radical SAM protein [Sulfurimonas aquatica]|uniref:Radical SAM protein n=1 Tax=Sulfurimonas aquatica TaxID=2672570 RepID=A0A975GCL9_9BACT|nr:radical SAM/SPASM domain-containing protein [Sulfurimonas aquatica]QSZ41750.1 radical SAM protein [Sulfurimonas aquatica]